MKRKFMFIAIVIIIALSGNIYSQDTQLPVSIPLALVEEKPEFCGGDVLKFRQWAHGQVVYPEYAIKNGVQGRVMLRFVIDKDGKVKNVQVLKGVHELLDAEAVRVVLSSPDWKPGRQKGEAVDVQLTLPIDFKLRIEQRIEQVNEDGTVPYLLMDEKPKFNGGDGNEFAKWVLTQMNYPVEAIAGRIQGRVILEFVIGKDGKVKNVQVLKGVHELLDSVSVMIVSSSPDWVPGKHKGEIVEVKYTFPIDFALPKGNGTAIAENTGQDTLSSVIEQKPTFRGGDANEFTKWVFSQIVYPKEAKKNGVQGRVTLQFIIDTTGAVTNVQVLRGVDASLDKEAVRVVSKSPKWEPDRINGKAVKVKYTYPVMFQLR